jgi:HK97 family phage major capsid protein
MRIDGVISNIKAEIKLRKMELAEMIERGERESRTVMTAAENKRSKALFHEIDELKDKLARAEAVKVEDDEADMAARDIHPTDVRSPHKVATVHIGNEPRTYSRENDPEGKGTAFLTDVIGAFRGNPASNERLARHAREYEVDNKGRKTRAAGDVATGNLPNLVIPQYLVSLYAARPSAARPFADICRHEDLPAEGMKVELAKGNTSATAALQTTELTAAGGGNYDADPLELSVQTAEAWQLVSRQAIDRGRVTENVIMGDMLDQMAALLDSTLITQAATGLYASGTRITYDDASPTVTALYPSILQGASKSAQTLLNRGKPTHVLMHPRRWYWMQSLVDSKWPVISPPGLNGQQSFGAAEGGGYEDGGYLPCGLRVIQDANVQTAALAGADTGGTQDIIYIIPQNEAILFEAPQREVFIRAEAPAANQLGVMLVVYEYFAYTFSRYAATAFQRINGTGTIPPTGF